MCRGALFTSVPKTNQQNRTSFLNFHCLQRAPHKRCCNCNATDDNSQLKLWLCWTKNVCLKTKDWFKPVKLLQRHYFCQKKLFRLPSQLVFPGHCSTVLLCHCATMPLCLCATVPLCHSATALLCHCTNVPLYHLPLHHCTTVPMCYCAATVPLYHCTTVPLCQCATVPLSYCCWPLCGTLWLCFFYYFLLLLLSSTSSRLNFKNRNRIAFLRRLVAHVNAHLLEAIL